MRPFHLTSPLGARPKASRTAKKANAHGKHFEAAIEWSAGIHKQVVALEHLPALGAKRVGGGKIVPTRICIDFIGCFEGGTALFFDAKSVDGDVASFDVMGLSSPHQRNFLRKMHERGAVAGFIIEWKAGGQYLWLDIIDVDEMGPIRFRRDGRLCRQFKPIGAVGQAVDFAQLKKMLVDY